MFPILSRLLATLAALSAISVLGACVHDQNRSLVSHAAAAPMPTYQIGAGDTLKVFVWRNEDLSVDVPVRPDGRISLPLVADMLAAGKTPTGLADDIEQALATYVQSPEVTVIVTNVVNPYSQQVRVIGQVDTPQAIVYREDMSVLDAMIAVGGLTEIAAGNRAAIIRRTADGEARIDVDLDDLIEDGDMSHNLKLRPGDVIVVPEAWF